MGNATWRHFRLFKILFKLKIVQSVTINGTSSQKTEIVDVMVAEGDKLELNMTSTW